MSRVRTISVYLLKPDVTDAAQALRDDVVGLDEHRFSVPGADGTAFVAPPVAMEPDWVKLLRPATLPPLDLRSQSPSTVLVLQTSGRWFAIAFGRGWTLLDASR